jgi:diguanylate cyclase
MSAGIEETAYWKERYFTLLNEGEKRQNEQNEYESLLSRAVVRLTLAASGLDAALDPHLRAIREVMRKGQSASLRQEMDALLDTLVRVPKSDSVASEPTPGQELLRFLEAQCAELGEQSAIAALRRRLDSGGFADEAQLFASAARLLRAQEAAPRPQETGKGVMGRLFGKAEPLPPPPPPSVDGRALRLRLDELLGALNPPGSLEARVGQLRLMIADPAEDLVVLFNSAASLIAELDAERWKEQKQLCDFLAALSGKLGELEAKTLRMDTLGAASARDRQETQKAVTGQMADLRADASKATELGQLRAMITLRLDLITGQLDAYGQAEETRYSEAQAQIQELSLRLRTLEQESEDLRNRLVLANRAAYLDPLTKLPNRNAYLERIDLEEKRWQRFKQPLSLAVWDIDYFKKVNDRFGHSSGDKVLAFIGGMLANAVRNTDFVARYGGEEFVMLLVGADDENALELAEALRIRVEGCEFTSDGKRIPITLSCGISQFKGRDVFGDVFERADQALYQAKRKGRNRCEIL